MRQVSPHGDCFRRLGWLPWGGDMRAGLRITSDGLGVDLTEARTLVDDYLAHNPEMRKQMSNGRSSRGTDWIVSLEFVLLLWWAAVCVLSR